MTIFCLSYDNSLKKYFNVKSLTFKKTLAGHF